MWVLEDSLADAKGSGFVFTHVDPNLLGVGIRKALPDEPGRDTTARKAFKKRGGRLRRRAWKLWGWC